MEDRLVYMNRRTKVRGIVEQKKSNYASGFVLFNNSVQLSLQHRYLKKIGGITKPDARAEGKTMGDRR